MSEARKITALDMRVTQSTVDDLENVSTSAWPARARDGWFIFTQKDPGTFELNVQGAETLFGEPHVHKALVRIDADALFTKVEACRNIWRQFVVDHVDESTSGIFRKTTYPFQQRTNFSADARPDALDRVGGRLAEAGDRLYRAIFRPPDDNSPDPRLTSLADALEAALRKTSLILTFHSDDLFIPWPLLYTPVDGQALQPNGANWHPSGFWGARHFIEHRTDSPPVPFTLTVRNGRIGVGIAVDTRLDEQMPRPIVRDALEFFSAAPIPGTSLRGEPLSVRTTRDELLEAFKNPELADQIAYFCCHGIATGNQDRVNLGQSRIALSDGEAITVDDLSEWLRFGASIRGRGPYVGPIVLLNSCQGGQANSLFYHSFAREWLSRRASCVLGPQVDIPGVFAAEYASRFFSALLKGEERVGTIVRDLAAQFLYGERNPLGLVYSLYRGMDTHLRIARL